MAKGRTLYEPGELDRVRKNLGDLDPDEARRVARLLGGEVGYEKSPEPQHQRKIARPPSAQDTSIAPPRSSGASFSKASRSASPRFSGEIGDGIKTDGAFETPRQGLSYSQRLKMDFICSQPDFLIKTQGQVIVSFFSFLPGMRDGVNPFFLNSICPETFAHLETLAKAARILYPPRRPDIQERLKLVPPFHRAMEILVSIDLQAISHELAELQRAPREAELPRLATLVREVFIPVVRLRRSHEGGLLRSAAEWALAASPEADPAALSKLQAARDSLLAETDYLFMNVAYRWYPLLMRLCSRKSRDYVSFYEEDMGRILAFLGLRADDILPAKTAIPEMPPPVEKSPEERPEEEPAAPEKEDLLETMGQALEIGQLDDLEGGPTATAQNVQAPRPAGSDLIPASVRKGLDILDGLFPDSGLAHPELGPDLYPYFNSLYPLPKGSDLIAPGDPLMQVIVLAYVLNDLFHGLRRVQWGLNQGDAENEDLGESVNGALNDWMSPCDEVLGKRYLPLLSEYCRLLETERESQSSSFAMKREADLLFYKKRYFLPFTKGAVFSGLQAPRDKDLRPMYKLSALMKRNLTAAAQDIDRAVRSRQEGGSYTCVAILNPFEPARLEVENLASERLRAILKHEGPAPRKLTNAALIYYSLAILETFDYLVNSPASWAYREERAFPYRALSEGQTIKPGMEVDADKAFRQRINRLIQSRKKAAAYEKQTRPSGESPVSPAPGSVDGVANPDNAGADAPVEAAVSDPLGDAAVSPERMPADGGLKTPVSADPDVGEARRG
jgi:hypothetical protein